MSRVGYRLEKNREPGPSFFAQLLLDRLKSADEIVFVQIGANDGTSFDPIYPLIQEFKGRFRGLVVEPLRDKFELLKRAYADVESIVPVNVAIHNTEKEMFIHRVRPDLEPKLPAWAKGIGSFNPAHYELSRLDSSYMVAEKVVCMTFDDLLTTYKIDDAELLITDTEGYDFELLQNIDFKKHHPTYIRFEHGLSGGTMSWERYRRLIRYLTGHGYSVSQEADDATAFLPQALEDPS